jgi:S1-C subfamily serine protease
VLYLAFVLTLSLSADPNQRVDLPQLIERARVSTVQVSGEWRQGRRRSTRWGGGVLVGDNHAVLTCLHVVDGYPHLFIQTHDDVEHGAKLIATFPDRDLALLQMESKKRYAGLSVKRGTWSGNELGLAVGYPQHNDRSIILGKIKSIRRDVVYSSVTPDTPLLAFRGETSLGFSGGPLLNMRGEFVGLIVAKADDEDGLAIPASDILATLGYQQLPIPKEELWADRSKPLLPNVAQKEPMPTQEDGSNPQAPISQAQETASQQLLHNP